MTSPANLSLRAALITRAKADAALATAMGGTVRFVEYVPEANGPDALALPFLHWRSDERAWDTTSDRGREHSIEVSCFSRAEGRKEVDQILHALELCWRDWAPQTLTDHRLVNLDMQMGDVIREDGGQTYVGYQRWRAVTEEL